MDAAQILISLLRANLASGKEGAVMQMIRAYLEQTFIKNLDLVDPIFHLILHTFYKQEGLLRKAALEEWILASNFQLCLQASLVARE
mmetsp:Transcript_20131/g.30895  ORF Transcript_20131/g.30895 Transcript_20131/m.30895 type:complete len:87 (-) Transcript_20131:138-398(-)